MTLAPMIYEPMDTAITRSTRTLQTLTQVESYQAGAGEDDKAHVVGGYQGQQLHLRVLQEAVSGRDVGSRSLEVAVRLGKNSPGESVRSV